MYVMIRKTIADYVKIIDILYDTFVLVKISKEQIGGESDYMIVNIYIPPQNSSFYKIHSCDLFYELENQIVKYTEEGTNIFGMGDLNARTAK